MKAWAWLIQAAKDAYSFVYTEAGTVLKLLKDPAGKFSHKRILALAFGVAAIYFLFMAPIRIPEAVLMAVGATIGGFLGARLAQKLPPMGVRLVSIGIGLYAGVRMLLR